ncbi:MAG: magnesium transporter [Bacteriovoracaceae bacterium]|nr:magnesium transporter [Bacteriovoracaceae bacterium]
MEENQNPDEDNQEILQNLDETGQTEELVEMFEELPTPDVVEFLEDKSIDEIISYLNDVDAEDQGRIFSDFSIDLQVELCRTLDRRKIATIFRHMYSDIRADLYQELTKDEQIGLLPYLDKKVREDVIILSAYPPETAGGIMNTDFATVFEGMSVAQAMAKIRHDAPSKDMVIYIYVIDDVMVMKGFVTLKDLVLADPNAKVSDLLNEFFVHAEVNEDRESVAQKIEKYDLAAIPVLNSLNQLVGIVGHDDAIQVMQAEQTEDLERLAGVMPSEEGEDYMQTSTLRHFRKRVVWLVGLAAMGIISGIIINEYQGVLEHFIILAMYMPMMASTGGNTGTQAATVIIRALSLGHITDDEWIKIVFKEIRISAMLSICVALLTYFKIVFLSFHGLLPEGFTMSFVGLTISLAIAIQVVTSAVIGAGLPLIVRRLGGDPAVVASPAISTIVDITGLLIYFSVASALLGVA